MVIDNKSVRKVILRILKDFFNEHTVTSLSEGLKLTRVGMWKILKKLELQGLIILSKIGKGKTSTYTVSLNWKNPLTEKILAFYLSQEAQEYQRWIFNFEELKGKVDFLILFGSVLHSPKEANDIDILGIAKGNKMGKINDAVLEIQKLQTKKIHSTNFTEKEFEKELVELQNKIFLDALKKGIVLFGQENFIKFVRKISE